MQILLNGQGGQRQSTCNQGSSEAWPTMLTWSSYWYVAHLINVSKSINQVNYCRTLTLIPLNPALDDNQ